MSGFGRRQPRGGIEGQSEHPGARPHLWDSEDGRKVVRGILATSSDAAVEAAPVATPTESGSVEWRGAAASQDPHAPVEGRGLVGDGRRRRGHERRRSAAAPPRLAVPRRFGLRRA
jgi:hypothetical protein